MCNSRLCNELIELADIEQLKIEQNLPKDPTMCLVIFIETVRVLDFIMLGQPGVSKKDKKSFSVFDTNMIEMGWNLSTSLLLKSRDNQGFPMRRSTDASRNQAMNLLIQLGIIVQLRRTTDMVKTGLVNVHKTDSTYEFSLTSEAKDQFLDELETVKLCEFEKKLKSSGMAYKDWELIDSEILKKSFWQDGNFLSVNYRSKLDSFKIKDIDSKMIPLINQWDLGNHGIMIGYDSTPEIDYHFLAIAAELTTEWRDEAGIHSNTKIGNIFASDIIAVVMMIISFRLKHIHFTQLASENDSSINIPQSLSIWTPSHELIKNISDFSGIKQHIVKESIHAITLKPEDEKFLRRYTSRFRPLLIDIGNDYLFQPASCILRNPLHMVFSLLESRNPSLIDSISHLREEWIRDYLYSMFAGTRYQRLKRNIRIRKEGNIITDVDAGVYDNLTGDLALFQIKWQDYFTNDVKKLRSKAKNFVAEIIRWSEKIETWINSQDILHVIRSLQLKETNNKLTKSKIYLFGLSKNVARMKGYGYKLNNVQIAVTAWPQFVRNRIEIGPSPQVISKLFKSLKVEENAEVKSRPIPVKIPFAGLILDFKDIWSITEDGNE